MAVSTRPSHWATFPLALLLSLLASFKTIDAIASQEAVQIQAQVGSSTEALAPEPLQSGLTIAILDSITRLPGGLSSLPAPPIPNQNPQTQAKIDLGKLLFFDTALSIDHSMSCASCHDPARAYSDGRAVAIGIAPTKLRRRCPSLLNSAFNATQFWDGRAKSLEEQALIPVLSMSEMGMRSRSTLLARLQSLPEYRRRFRQTFGRPLNLRDVARAIAAFERTLISPDSAFDRYARGDKNALTDAEKQGLILFIGKASCSQCHNGPNFTDDRFYSLGLLTKPFERSVRHENEFDLGHFTVSNRVKDRYAFKTPGLRSANRQSHYMHDGSLATLEQVIDFYDEGGGPGPKSALLFKLHLTTTEKNDLLAFLNALR